MRIVHALCETTLVQKQHLSDKWATKYTHWVATVSHTSYNLKWGSFRSPLHWSALKRNVKKFESKTWKQTDLIYFFVYLVCLSPFEHHKLFHTQKLPIVVKYCSDRVYAASFEIPLILWGLSNITFLEINFSSVNG